MKQLHKTSSCRSLPLFWFLSSSASTSSSSSSLLFSFFLFSFSSLCPKMSFNFGTSPPLVTPKEVEMLFWSTRCASSCFHSASRSESTLQFPAAVSRIFLLLLQLVLVVIKYIVAAYFHVPPFFFPGPASVICCSEAQSMSLRLSLMICTSDVHSSSLIVTSLHPGRVSCTSFIVL